MPGSYSSDRRPAISFTSVQKLKLIFSVFAFVGTIFRGLVTGIFRGKNGTRTYSRHAVLSVLYALTTRFDVYQLQYIGGNSDKLYLDYCKASGITPDFAKAKNGAKGYWLGSRTARNVIIWFHGGGFAMNLTPAYFQVWRKIQTDLAAKGVDFAVFFSVYTLTPHGTYPKQFQEAVEAVDYVVKEEGRRPQDVLIAGDSAGGNMCLGVISHLSHPSEQAPKLDIEGNLAGMIMVSPWVSFDTTWPTMTRNAARDSLNTGTLNKWSETYLNGKTSDNYSEPGLATAEWWESARVDHTIVTVGTDEVFLDAIRSWGDKFKAANNEIELAIAEEEIHIEPFIMANIGNFSETGQEKAIKDWLLKNFSVPA